ncbi:uncharacterized protein LOC103854577 [Brassica rapa]|uniref:BnaA02g30610D protein n=3 Tax=Brassica TaxID=3705 RepID=A0A078H7T3_BRANA|nr:uncharacterized protein LOC103854577 [Brassica rapa]XP_013721237.1 uncharacterized protein BNAA02G30610D [Brassica napus]KAH0939972.1 hypothetical protein HID58_007433 [Brassica napus]CAF2144171.1 unnamed protein product [Brassica napus]CDY33926.1 BnaA02g30610D [Brassica napus]
MSSNTSPIFSDYGFDPQIDYFQVLEEARKHKKETSSIDSIHQFKLQKPISKDDLIRTALHKKNKKQHRWFWRNALLFFSWRKWRRRGGEGDIEFDDRDVHVARARNFRAGSMSGPVYVTESLSGSSTPYRTIRPPSLTTVTPVVPYLSLRELSMERQQRISATSMSGPLYLVT